MVLPTAQCEIRSSAKSRRSRSRPSAQTRRPAMNVSKQELRGTQCIITVPEKPAVQSWLNRSAAGQTTTSPDGSDLQPEGYPSTISLNHNHTIFAHSARGQLSLLSPKGFFSRSPAGVWVPAQLWSA